ncbi:tubulin polyglutamylase complex subunit 2 isoform X2 [Dunckerocampus dactyliophorus]|uniref:tubulin polyglutamylase complex subunit 2 isoform X2 n=1 Tax=Dunckerocampus dactyliophorus TaxID=161453 RepID=UPI0024068B53|nr:tubulin polyglutamylase complex subunit 2 isoform X2 [Dunckerocampus dactyliophorus]
MTRSGCCFGDINTSDFIFKMMEGTKESVAFKSVAERLTLGITRILENMPGVVDVRLAEKEPAEKRSLLSWEQKNNCILPEDLRDFYLTTDGFTLTWNVKLDNECVPLGLMTIHSVGKLRPLVQPTSLFSLPNAPSLADLDWDDSCSEYVLGKGPPPPHFDSRSCIFELDSCGGNGKVCLVYKNSSPGVVAQHSEIWFLDRSLCWHFLTATFSSYYRLMITHLGLPEWQYSFTPYGPSPHAKWASLYQPLTFRNDLSLSDSVGDSHLNKLDPIKAFKAKAKVPTPKKKPSAPCSLVSNAKSQGSGGKPSVAKR